MLELGGDAELGGGPEASRRRPCRPARRHRGPWSHRPRRRPAPGRGGRRGARGRSRSPRRVVDDRPVPGQDALDQPLLDELTQVQQRVEVGPQDAVGVRDDGCAPAQDRVAAEQRSLGAEQEAARVGRVARCARRPRSSARRARSSRRRPAASAPRVNSGSNARARSAGQLDDPPQRLGVVEVPVGEQDEPDLAGRRQHRLQVGLVGRTGIDDDRRAWRPARAGSRCWCRRAS